MRKDRINSLPDFHIETYAWFHDAIEWAAAKAFARSVPLWRTIARWRSCFSGGVMSVCLC